MGTTTKTLYDIDFVEWTAETAELIRQRRFDQVDIEHVVEEIEDLGKSERSAVLSQMSRMLMHLVKRRIQPERSGRSWRQSIVDARREIRQSFKQSPSLRRFAESNLSETYIEAIRDALDETGVAGPPQRLGIPEQCPFTLDQLLSADLDSLTL